MSLPGLWPGLWFVTDPARIPDPAAVAASLPRGAGVIYRTFGRPDAEAVGRALRQATRGAGVILLVGADPRLARRIGADGVHLPERLAHLAPRIKARRPDWLVTIAAHSARAVLRAARFGAHAVVISAVFPSRSPSAGQALGPIRFETLARRGKFPVIALGGINARTAGRLRLSTAAGLAAVEGLADPNRPPRRGPD